jgi:hypothetical protein
MTTMPLSVDVLKDQVRRELSLGVRLRYTALAVAGLGMTALATSLLATEPFLPLWTRVAFVLIALGGVAWTSFAVWVLTQRRVLLANHQVTAATLATVLSATFLVVAIVFRERTGLGAVAMNGVTSILAALWWLRAKRHVAALRQRARAIEVGAAR